jgi:hypothetical protein
MASDSRRAVRESLPPPIPCKIIMRGVVSGMEGSSLKSRRSSTPSGVSTVCKGKIVAKKQQSRCCLVPSKGGQQLCCSCSCLLPAGSTQYLDLTSRLAYSMLPLLNRRPSTVCKVEAYSKRAVWAVCLANESMSANECPVVLLCCCLLALAFFDIVYSSHL